MTQTQNRPTARKTTAASKPAQVYTIHSLDEVQIDTRVTRIAALNADDARQLTTEIQQTASRLYLLVTEAHDRKAHLALGYETWADYCKAELNMSESRSYQYLDQGHVMKALAGAGVDIEAMTPPPVRVIARVKDRLTDVKKVATEALSKAEGDPAKAVDKAVRALAREPRKGRAAAASSAGATPPADADDATEPTPRNGNEVSCPACAGTGKVTKTVADRLLEVLKNLK